ncbi:MAG: chemotaxis protein methyltransferase CheR [Planctomycetaceae bacterium]|nr:chemotaxis protein methyltransferase CheR [Planctomycetaceae bacterium]
MESHETINESTLQPKANILLVDDVPANLLVLREILADLGHNMVEARSGEEALRRLLDADFAVVLLDVQMPGLDGFETAKLIRGPKTSRHLPIVFLTAFETDRSTVERAYSLGAVDFLIKPLVPVIVRAKVAGFIELFEKTRQIQWQADQIRQIEHATFGRKLAEENARLRASEARKAAILETALDCIITIDHQGRVIEFNPAAERVFGYAKHDIAGREIADFIIPPHLREAHHRGMAHLLATGEGPVMNKRIELSALRADGTEFPVELTIAQISSDGPPVFTAYLRDISERVRIERHRNTRLAVNQLLVQAVTFPEAAKGVLKIVCEGLAWDFGSFWTVDRETETLRCLECWHRPRLAFTEFEATTRSRSFRPGEGLPGRVWTAGQPAWILHVVDDANFPRAASAAKEGLHSAFGCPIMVGGRTLGVIEFFSQRIQESDPELLEMMATVAVQLAQFMERMSAEEQLRQSEQRFAGFMQHLPGLAWIKDLNGRYVYANDEAVNAFQMPRPELYGKTDDDVFPPETATRFKENDRRAMNGTGVQVIENLEHEDGILHHSLVCKFPIQGPLGTPFLVGGMAIDITDRVRAEESLKEANRRKDEFLATLAHELRNPLAPICNSLQILKLSQVDMATIDRCRDVMERQVQHLVRLVDDLLDVSRVMRGKIELRKEPVELATIIARAVETAKPLIEVQGHELEIFVPSESLLLDADPVRLVQVIANLLTNSAKYMDANGKIWLLARREDNQAILAVRDTGIGIAPDMLPHVFELFVQADHATTKAQGGLGIGLTLVKNLVEMHDGSVEAHSAGLGKGCEFVVRFPLKLQNTQYPVADKTSAQENRVIPSSGHQLLVVDDNHDAAVSLAVWLRLQGYEVRIAHDGVSALELVKSYRPDLIFLDLGMPRMDGFEVARRIRKMSGLETTILAALTGWGQAEDRRRTAEAGFDHHLVKPSEPKTLLKLLAELKPTNG